MLTDTEIYAAELRMWRERFEQHLDQVPVILETLRDQAHPLKAARLAEKVSGGGGEAPLPFRADPVDDCDDLWASLVEFVGEVAERLQEPSPAAAGASWATSNGVRGIGAGVSGDQAYKAGFALIAWLIDRAVKVRDLHLVDTEQHLFGLIRKLVKRYVDAPPIERPAHRRFCSVCGEKAVLVDWVLGDSGEAVCRVCGAVYAPEGMEEALVAEALRPMTDLDVIQDPGVTRAFIRRLGDALDATLRRSERPEQGTARLDYYDPARQDRISEHDCVFEDGEWWFGHGMPCKHPKLHAEPQGEPSDAHLRGRWSNGDPVHIITDGIDRRVAPNSNGATWIPEEES